MNLAGTWRLALDPNDLGIVEGWHRKRFEQTANLPGSLAEQGIGYPVTVETQWTGVTTGTWLKDKRYAPYRQAGNIKIPFWLQPETVYSGPAWYQRDIAVPSEWEGQHLALTIERPHISTTVWLDNICLGSQNSLSAPHRYLSGGDVVSGDHILTIRVDNRLQMDVGVNSHSVSDHTQGNWNGIVGAIELDPIPPISIGDIRLHPHAQTKSVTLAGQIINKTGEAGEGIVRLAAHCGTESVPEIAVPIIWDSQGAEFTVEYLLGETARFWDEFDPTVYSITIELSTSGAVLHRCTDSFGLREITAHGTQFAINGRTTFMRGTLECCVFPRTGYPPTNLDEWRHIFHIGKSHGLNLVRFHSWCPPEAAFQAADEAGIYLHVECSTWPNDPNSALGVGDPLDKWLYEEADQILAAYGNHPSFIFLMCGNEPGGKAAEYLGPWIDHFKTKDPRRLYSGCAGWPEIPQNQFHVLPDPRIQQWGEGLASRINGKEPATIADYQEFISKRSAPVISHEIGQWCAFPNFAEMGKYTGHLKPKNFEIFQDFLTTAGMADQAEAFLAASAKLQALCYKEEIESALRTTGMGGFELLGLNDFPGQGTALVGILDAFWDSKGGVSASEFRRFCNSTVLLARLPRRVFTTAEQLSVAFEVAHFGAEPIVNAKPRWQLRDNSGAIILEGTLQSRDIPVGNGIHLGGISLSLAKLRVPICYKLTVGLAGTDFENDWGIWVYPSDIDLAPPTGILTTDRLDRKAVDVLESGGRVLWTIPHDKIREPDEGPVELGFSPIFWNTAWTQGQAPHTLGILCDPNHPLFENFPTEAHANWQWWYPLSQAKPLLLDGLPMSMRPTVQIIDDWFTCRRLGLVVEARVGAGRLLITSIDLDDKVKTDPVTRQLVYSLLCYTESDAFQPTTELSLDQARSVATI